MRLRSALAAIMLALWVPLVTTAAEAVSQQIPVDLVNENGSFGGAVAVLVEGTAQKARVEWNGTIRNTSPHQIYRATFCIHAFDASDVQIRPGGEDCFLRLWGTNWPSGAPLNFKGKQSMKIGEGKTPVGVARYAIVATEVFDHSPNLRTVVASCPAVWTAALRVLADKKFRPTVMDRDSFTAAYAFEGGRVDRGSTQLLKAYTAANTSWTVTWESFRIDSASLYLREDEPSTCTAEVKMSFAGFGKQMFGKLGWYALDSNFNFEKQILDEIEAMSRQAADTDMDRAISRLPTAAAEPIDPSAESAQLTITSDPSGAEIEIDGEFIGNTPSTVSTRAGATTIRITKNGYQVWERTLTLSPGDQRTVAAEMSQ